MDVLETLADVMAFGKKPEVAADIARVLTREQQQALKERIPSQETRENFERAAQRYQRTQGPLTGKPLLVELFRTANSTQTMDAMRAVLGDEQFMALYSQRS